MECLLRKQKILVVCGGMWWIVMLVVETRKEWQVVELVRGFTKQCDSWHYVWIQICKWKGFSLSAFSELIDVLLQLFSSYYFIPMTKPLFIVIVESYSFWQAGVECKKYLCPLWDNGRTLARRDALIAMIKSEAADVFEDLTPFRFSICPLPFPLAHSTTRQRLSITVAIHLSV